jgi:hypothetical protein
MESSRVCDATAERWSVFFGGICCELAPTGVLVD